ncbi:minor capsid protein [Paraclostridium bifermentans]|uniref:Minor capsid protein n=1 Tax=Paraclostridium bifermentans TaxID=1490 RepID=A0AA44IGI9_PARBF|nr:phage minor capsid protein [Paraclostridium bifermentans]MBN8046933.1 minor capsid protein [Paraclostridium bifermentans]NME08995.1 minor capsid protein [Paraclostridium bifermentans]
MTLTPEELKNIPESFINLYQELEDFIIADIARRIAKVGNLTDSAKLQTIRANEIGISLNLIKEKIKEVSGLTKQEINELFNDVGLYSIAKENELYSAAGLDTVKITENEALANIMKSAIKQTSGDLYNLTQSMGFAQKINGKVVYKPIAKYYHDAMDLAVMQIKSGSINYNTAIKQAVDRLCESGIRSVDYESGVANRIDVAVRRAVMTGSNQMSQKLTLEGMKETGNDFVEITAHIGARPSHSKWQGKVFCYSGKSKEYPSFIESTGYGTGPGLGGWNCRHSFYPFIPGISNRAYTDEELDNIDPSPFEYNGKMYTYYEATQHQRQIERAIRKTRTQLVGYEAAGLKAEFTNASIILKQQEKYYREFSKVADIPTEKDRLQAYKFNKSISQKVVWSKKKYDQQEFNKFKDGLGTLAPKTLEEFKDIMYNKPIELNSLKEKFYIVNLYQNDFGNISPKKIIELDKLAFDAKRNNQISKYKKQGNFAILEYNNKIKFASSRIADETDSYYLKYKGDKSKLVLLKQNRIFKTSLPGDLVDGEVNTVPREFDTEAKFFEFLVDELKNEIITEINMISEKKMCESCKNVAKQFMKLYPGIKVNVVSGKTFDGWKGR